MHDWVACTLTKGIFPPILDTVAAGPDGAPADGIPMRRTHTLRIVAIVLALGAIVVAGVACDPPPATPSDAPSVTATPRNPDRLRVEIDTSLAYADVTLLVGGDMLDQRRVPGGSTVSNDHGGQLISVVAYQRRGNTTVRVDHCTVVQSVQVDDRVNGAYLITMRISGGPCQ